MTSLGSEGAAEAEGADRDATRRAKKAPRANHGAVPFSLPYPHTRRAIDIESQFVKHFMAEISAVLNSKVLIASFMKHREPWDVSSWRCPEIGDQGRTIVDHVACEQRVLAGKVVVDTDHAMVSGTVPLVRSDQVPGSRGHKEPPLYFCVAS